MLGLGWISLTGEQRSSLSQQSESEMKRRTRHKRDLMTKKLCRQSCKDIRNMKNRVTEGEMEVMITRSQEGIFIKQDSAPPSIFYLHGDLCVCVCV